MVNGGQALANQEAARNSTPGCGGQTTLRHTMTQTPSPNLSRQDPQRTAEGNREEQRLEAGRRRQVLGTGERFEIKCPPNINHATLDRAIAMLRAENVTIHIADERLGTENSLLHGQDTIVHSFAITMQRDYERLLQIGNALAELGFTLMDEANV